MRLAGLVMLGAAAGVLLVWIALEIGWRLVSLPMV